MADATTEERWLPVVGYPGYEVSDHGRVRSVDRVVDCIDGRRIPYSGQLLAQCLDEGYLYVTLGRRNRRRVHHLVLEAFTGPRPAKMDACHEDDIGTNNTLRNLRWGTRRDNMQDRIRNGRNPQVNKTHCPREHPLTEPNLVPSQARKGRRDCLACNRAETLIRWRKKQGSVVPELRPLADAYFVELMTGSKAVVPRRHWTKRRPRGKSGDHTDAA